MEKEERIIVLLREISEDERYVGSVFSAPGIYFTIHNGEIREISNDAGNSHRGQWFPELITGPSSEENACLEAFMKKLGFDECFFDDILDEFGEFDEDDTVAYFEDNDEDSLEIYKKIAKKVDGGKTPFDSMEDFVWALKHYGLDSGALYYEWEGEYINLHENICEAGEGKGYFESFSAEEWISILENMDKYIVSA